VLQANPQILQEVLKMRSAKTLAQVLEESGITVDWVARGREEGEENKQREIAQNALQAGSSPEFVQQITGLEFEAIAKMQESLAVAGAR
jgi:predicted transposase YdaD